MKRLISLFLVLLLSACGAGFNRINREYMSNFIYGDYDSATTDMVLKTQNVEEDDSNVYLGGLQCGTSALWANDAQTMQMCFNNSESILSGHQKNNSSYKVKDYERIMLKTYDAIGQLSTSNKHIRQTLLQAYDLQVNNVNNNSSEIAEAKKQLSNEVEGLPDIDSIIKSVDAEIAKQDNAVIAMKDYVNPYTTYLAALWDSLNGDKSNGYNYLKRMQSFAPLNRYVSSDINSIESGKKYVWVFFENGLVGQLRVRTLAPVILQVFNIRVTIPDIVRGTKALSHLGIRTTDGKSFSTEFLASIDSIVKTDFDKYKTENIIKSISFELTKLAAATTSGVAVSRSFDNKNRGTGNLLGYMTALTIMSADRSWDLRSWTSLPSEVQLARIEMPNDRTLLIGDKKVIIPHDISNAAIFVRLPTSYADFGIVVGKLN